MLYIRWSGQDTACIRVSTLHKNTTPFFPAKPHLSSVKLFQALVFRQSPSVSVFHELATPKRRIFQWTPKILKFLSLTPSYLWKVTKFLVKFSQFEFLVMTEKNISVYKLFLSLNISDFSCFFFQIATPLEKVTLFFPATPISKLRSCQASPFWKFGRSTPYARVLLQGLFEEFELVCIFLLLFFSFHNHCQLVKC